MISTLLALALSSTPPWNEVRANGFVFEMPSTPQLENGPVSWPTTGQMIRSEWRSKVTTGDAQVDSVTCFESTVESPRMIGLLHEKFCKDAPGQLHFDRTDAVTQARECLRTGPGPDGLRRTLVKVMQVGANVCMLSSSTKTDKQGEEVSPQMRRFVDSLKVTGKQTILAATTPWVRIKGRGFSFELPEAVEPRAQDAEQPGLGKYKSTQWKLELGPEKLIVDCSAGPIVGTRAGAKLLLDGFLKASKGPTTQTKLPSGATELVLSGPPSGLVRFHTLPGQTCVIGATREAGETTQEGRRFVESFAKTK